ncbi:efflux RND transporter permease subunit, partial [Candidatus Sumerlaeota bacterium]|nr:efflux RND transporter permease subunit [Candidatus Sumerlaeota bacterium]
MNLIDLSVKNATAVVVGMILVVLFGALAYDRIPVQLNPTIDQPIITIETDYPGAAPSEVESEITRRQEGRLAAVENVRRMRSISREGQAEVTLEFDWGTDKGFAGQDVSKKLDLVEYLNPEIKEPQIFATSSEEGNSIMRVTVQSDRPVNEVRELLEDRVGPRLERVSGVSRVQWYGGSRREIQVQLEIPALESRHITISEVIQALGKENQNQRGGKIEEGNSRLLVRTVGQFDSLEAIRKTVVKNNENGPVRIEDIAQVMDTYHDPERIGRTMGKPSVSMGISKKTGTNTLDVTRGLQEEVERINKEMEPQGIHLWITYNISDYIWESIHHVWGDLIYGSVLAVAVLILFLRSFSGTLAIGLTIPICTVGTFVLLAAFGRSVNVISLAGLAFATGMVVDDGIVVVENIFRHRAQFGSDPVKAAREAALEVWAPVLASTLTTLAVFIPVLFIQEEAGQLFRDIAYSISFAVGLSLIASITVVPMVMSRLARRKLAGNGASPQSGSWTAWLDRTIGGVTAGFFEGIVRRGLNNRGLRLLIMGAIFAGFAASLWLVPPAEYLPQSKSSFIFGFVTMPSGMSLEGTDAAMKKIEERVLKLPNLFRTFFIAMREHSHFGIFMDRKKVGRDEIEKIAKDVESYARSVLPSDVRVSVERGSDFGWRSGGGKKASIDILGPDMDVLQGLSRDLEDRFGAMPGVINVVSSLNLANPELQVRPDRERLADLGLTARDLAQVVETMLEGTRASLYREGGKEYDLILKAREGQIVDPDQLRAVTIKSPRGRDVRLDEVAAIERRLGPVTIERLEQERVITLNVILDDKLPLETFITRAESEIMGPFRKTLPPLYRAELSGTVDDLRRTIKALSYSFILAVVITYLL